MPETLEALLDRLGWTPYSIAREAKLSPNTVRAWVRGEHKAWGEKVERLAAALGVSVARVRRAIAAARK